KKFRGWLKKTATHRIMNLKKREGIRNRREVALEERHENEFAHHESPGFSEALQRDWFDYITTVLLSQVSNQRRVSQLALNLFNRYVFQGYSADEVAKEFKVKKQDVYNAKANIRPLVEETFDRLKKQHVEFKEL
ncbi:MAG: hypothetical protein AAF492_15440, partial [Verrucomicrobiota bacterium]